MTQVLISDGVLLAWLSIGACAAVDMPDRRGAVVFDQNWRRSVPGITGGDRADPLGQYGAAPRIDTDQPSASWDVFPRTRFLSVI